MVWINGKGKTLLNFFVHCLRGTILIRSIDASTHLKDETLLCELMDGLVRDIGLPHVQMTTYSVAYYVVAGNLLIES